MTTRKLLLLVALLSAVTVSPLHAQFLREDTAVTINLGPFLDALDGVTAEDSIAAATMEPNIKLSKNGGAFALRNSTTDPTFDNTGWYRIELDATDTSTPGKLIVKVHDSAVHVPVWMEFMVVSANTYDSLVNGSDALNADVDEWNGSAVATPDSAGHPKVTIKDGAGTGEIDTSSGKLTLTTAEHLLIAKQDLDIIEQDNSVDSVHSQTDFELDFATNDDLVGCEVFIYDLSDNNRVSRHHIASHPTTTRITIDSSPVFMVTESDAIRVFRTPKHLAAIKAKTDPLTFTVGGEVNANTRYWAGSLIPSPNVTGVPKVDITHLLGVPVCD